MLSLGISRGFAFVDFYHLQDATRWMETNQVASQSPSLVLILEIWKITQKATKVHSISSVERFWKKKKTHGLYATESKDLVCILIEMIIFMIYLNVLTDI